MAKNRPLRNVYQRLGNFEPELRDIVSCRGRASILEIGCGFGLPMIELIRRFDGKVSPVGINHSAEFNRPKKALIEGVRRRALPPWAPFTHRLRYKFPTYVNCDAALPLPFEDNSFDFCYSMATVFFITDRISLLKEISRILRPGMKARLHFSYSLAEFRKFSTGEWSDESLDLIRIEDGEGRRFTFPEIVSNVPGLSLESNNRYEWLELVASDVPIDFGLEFCGSRSMKAISDMFPQDFPRSEYKRIEGRARTAAYSQFE